MGKCFNTVEVAAPPEKVWGKIRDFHDLSWATGVVTQCDAVGDKKGNQVGAKRLLNQAFHETLLTLNDAGRTFSYSIDDGPGPVSKETVNNCVGQVTVSPGKEPQTSLVEWQSTFESKDENAVSDFCNPIYKALLTALKKKFN